MEDDERFSQSLLKLINLPVADGESMVAISRAILRTDYSDNEYEEELFSIFILVDEETGHITLDGFDEFNVASDRHSLSDSYIDNTINIVRRPLGRSQPQSNSKLYKGEIEDIFCSYYEQFIASIRVFKSNFGLDSSEAPGTGAT